MDFGSTVFIWYSQSQLKDILNSCLTHHHVNELVPEEHWARVEPSSPFNRIAVYKCFWIIYLPSEKVLCHSSSGNDIRCHASHWWNLAGIWLFLRLVRFFKRSEAASRSVSLSAWVHMLWLVKKKLSLLHKRGQSELPAGWPTVLLTRPRCWGNHLDRTWHVIPPGSCSFG